MNGHNVDIVQRIATQVLILDRLSGALLRTLKRPPLFPSRMATTNTTNVASIEITPGFRLHTENTSHILLSSNEAFLNPVQEFNRDLSVACIRIWSEELNKVKEGKWMKAQSRKKRQKSGRHFFC